MASLSFIFSLFSNNLQNKTVDFSGIWTGIIGVEGKHADPLTKTNLKIRSSPNKNGKYLGIRGPVMTRKVAASFYAELLLNNLIVQYKIFNQFIFFVDNLDYASVII